MANEEEAKLRRFLQWLQFNGAELRGCDIKYCDSAKGFGVVSKGDVSDGMVILVVPLDLAITPARVLQDPLLGPDCSSMLEKGELDDRLLMMLFLTVERIRENSVWKPYFDVLPTTFGTPLWFNDDELLELKGTTLHRATELQRKSLRSLFDNKVKNLVEKILAIDGNSKRTVCFDDFLWANSIFWSRALSIPFPRSYAFPQVDDDRNSDIPSNINAESSSTTNHEGRTNFADMIQGETTCVEGLVPGIDFCNHDLKAAATWEVDNSGSESGVINSMYLLSARQSDMQDNEEISISYGNKGNEELLCLYGFVIDENPDDYLMVHYPADAIQNVAFAESKTLLLEAQKGELKCLLPRNLLEQGFFPSSDSEKGGKKLEQKSSNYSWSGQRKIPSYLNKLVFPDNFLTSLRTIVMQEEELDQVSLMLHELVGTDEGRQPSDIDVRAAIWEVCGDSGAFQLLVDLLNLKVMDLEEGSGTEDRDSELLLLENEISRRRGQKELARSFLKEAEHALQLALTEERS